MAKDTEIMINRLLKAVAALATEIEVRDDVLLVETFPRQSIEEKIEMILYPEHFKGRKD